jgi:hypothetical protein
MEVYSDAFDCYFVSHRQCHPKSPESRQGRITTPKRVWLAGRPAGEATAPAAAATRKRRGEKGGAKGDGWLAGRHASPSPSVFGEFMALPCASRSDGELCHDPVSQQRGTCWNHVCTLIEHRQCCEHRRCCDHASCCPQQQQQQQQQQHQFPAVNLPVPLRNVVHNPIQTIIVPAPSLQVVVPPATPPVQLQLPIVRSTPLATPAPVLLRAPIVTPAPTTCRSTFTAAIICLQNAGLFPLIVRDLTIAASQPNVNQSC